MRRVRVRFAPSPTGPLHIGGVRTALYNYLFAKKHGGDFILRIEDTDQKRYVPKATDYILEAFEWLGISPNEGYKIGGNFGPYRQSERLDIYKPYVEKLIEKGKAYYAFDTPEELDALRKEGEEQKRIFSYDASRRLSLRNSLTMSQDEVQQLLDADTPYVVRFKIEPDRILQLQDVIRGNMEINTNTLDDKVLFKNDGFPTYHLANIVDDHLMEISHVIRGEEWLPSLGLHVLLYEALEWEAPEFAHLPLLLKPEGKGKLSKRDAEKGGFPIFPLSWETEEGTALGYREAGFLPEAVVNLLALLGWNPGNDEEIFSLEQLERRFSLAQVQKSGARFSYDKAKFFNQEHLKNTKVEDLLPALNAWCASQAIEKPQAYQLSVLTLMLPRATFISDVWQDGRFFYFAPTDFDEQAMKKALKPGTAELLGDYLEELANQDFEQAGLKAHLEGFKDRKNIGFGQIMQPLRLALCGHLTGPDLFAIFELLGKEETLKRIAWFKENKLG